MLWFLEHWREFGRSILVSFGAIFLALEAFEVLTDANIKIPFLWFSILGVVPGVLFFLLDGYQFSGFLRREINIPISGKNAMIVVKFGDLFQEEGWKVIGVNDFFDSKVDEDIVSSKSLHGRVLNNFWSDNTKDWEKQIRASLRNKTGDKEARAKGNRTRYKIGTTARACTAGGQKFLFVALGKTNVSNNVTSANSEMLLRAIRGMLSEARAACSMEPLAVPLMGSGLSRVGIKNSFLVDLIITAVLEETKNGLITQQVKIVLPKSRATEFNLKNHIRNWSDGK